MKNEKIIEKDSINGVEESKPTIGKGNYIIEVISDGNIIKKIAVANSSINIIKLADGGLTVDLK
ncbi:MAG: hypothetical protein E6940_14975 [Clostridium septicum]|uniref:hypothetical protein n=1 Tax=Clostridium septicum TaxID=1504 RepID=UPI00258D3A27|nr:hypothetical protein [Clostridium septicum]MDU1315331.1 hypothetical protein [Clostridium septicum]